MSRDIDELLQEWEYVPGQIRARLVKAQDGREVIQVRVDLGILQLETEKRPDGTRPGGYDSYYDYLLALKLADENLVLDEDQQEEVDREFLQYYQRRICWLALREFERAVEDADHNLALLDFIHDCSPSDDWYDTHDQYRPFILYHRTQASALSALEEASPDKAILEIKAGLDRLRLLFLENGADEQFDQNEMVQRLVQMQDALREEYEIGPTLEEQLADAVEQEDYELAARIRDQIARRDED